MSRLALIRNNLLPPLLPTFYKGQLGKLAVIGGCEDYTGAPYFSAHSAMLSGVDLVHIICEQAAAPVIKAYSPDLMVHPYILDSESMEMRTKRAEKDEVMAKQMDKIVGLVSKMDVLVVGPGFGRNDPQMNEFLLAILDYVLNKSERRDVPVILDADALYHLSVNKQLQTLVKDSQNANIILTPNVVEFKRLSKAFSVADGDEDAAASEDAIVRLCKVLNCTVIQKGPVDKVCYHGKEVLECGDPGSLKRVGGQGDSLTGMVGAFLCWATGAYKRGLYETPDKLSDKQLISLSCLAGCTTTRRAGHMAYKKYGRGMLTSNLHEFIGAAFEQLGSTKE